MGRPRNDGGARRARANARRVSTFVRKGGVPSDSDSADEITVERDRGRCRVTESKFQFAFRALRHRNYRLFFTGQSMSLIGTWMTMVATSWLVYRLTNSAWLLGLTVFMGQIPAFFLAPLAGVWLDRWNKHPALVVTQALAMIQSFALAALALTGAINIW